MTIGTAADYRSDKPHPVDETPKPRWVKAADGRFTDISENQRFNALFAEWAEDACTHERTGIIRWVNGGGQVCFNWFCAHCGVKSPRNIPHALAAEARIENSTLDDMHARSKVYVAQRQKRLDDIQANCADDAQASNRESNDDYLRSPQWAALRSRILARARGTCEACLEAPAAQVHHLTYEHYGHELAWELRAVCTGCHERIHAREAAE